MIIAVDFDGTIVEHKYPAIGKEIPFAFETLRKLQTEHHKLILWSVREGKLLDEAVTFCRERGLEFYAVNRDYPEEEKNLNNHFSRKLKADIFIDDRKVNIESVEAMAKNNGIEFVGIEYTASKDKKIAPLNQKRARLQLLVLEKEQRWLSDEEASKAL